ncbi:hypothetical protein HKD24_13070 [Gluconobacter sp. LMG 31484]|uniref:Uncharacterized protein n=1 Tax=Gluconobacter vitians TaxID=2728102 RepID=A0ABR9Y866_9PROT|nr:hypothetical protein [Gluconobacter vitians]MBF0860132.1 hypothetical protein [Gluconobacter vitians]
MEEFTNLFSDVSFSFDEMASLRSFMIATVLEADSAVEMEAIGYISVEEILLTSNKIHSTIRRDIPNYHNIFNEDDYHRIRSCIFFGQITQGIYDRFKGHIDYGTCDFQLTLNRISEIFGILF